MPKQIPESVADAIGQIVGQSPGGASIRDIGEGLEDKSPRRTIQRRLARLVEQKRLTIGGRGRGSHYRLPAVTIQPSSLDMNISISEAKVEAYVRISPGGKTVKKPSVCRSRIASQSATIGHFSIPTGPIILSTFHRKRGST